MVRKVKWVTGCKANEKVSKAAQRAISDDAPNIAKADHAEVLAKEFTPLQLLLLPLVLLHGLGAAKACFEEQSCFLRSCTVVT